MAVKGSGDALPTAGFLHAQVVNIHFHPVGLHTASPVVLDHAEAVAQYLPGLFGDENRPVLIPQQSFQRLAKARSGEKPQGEDIRDSRLVFVCLLVFLTKQET